MHSFSTASHGLFASLPGVLAASLLLGAVMALLHFLAPRKQASLLQSSTGPLARTTVIVVFGLLYLALAAEILLFPGYVDPGEPLLAAVSYLSLHGHPAYQLFIPYGPFCFLPYGLMMRLFGASVATLKATVLLSNIVLISLLYLVFRKLLSQSASLLAIVLVLAASCMKEVYLFQIRGDLFIYIAVALALLAAGPGAGTRSEVASSKGQGWAIALLAIALTVGIGVKITAVLYLLYPCALFLRRRGLPPLGVAIIATVLLSLLPFAIPTLSLHDYIYWLKSMSGELKSRRELVANIFTSAVLIAPCLLMYWQFFQRNRDSAIEYLREQWFPITALLVGLLGVDYLGGKVGAGRHHLIPFFILVGYLLAEMYWQMQQAPSFRANVTASSAYFWAVFGLLLLFPFAGELRDEQIINHLERPQVFALRNDVSNILKKYPGNEIALGDGKGLNDLNRTYSPMYAAAQLVFHGAAYTLDPSTQADIEVLKIPQSAASFQAFRSCASPIWLIPKGDAPFDTESIYSSMYPKEYAGHHIFSEEFQQAFRQSYAYAGSSRFFDLYRCRTNN